MKKLKTDIKLWSSTLLLVLFLTTTIGCGDDDDSLSPSEVRLTDGFVFTSFISGSGTTVEYFPTLPSGIADLSGGTTFESFGAGSVFDGALYGRQTDDERTLVKYGIDGNEELVIDASVTTSGQFPFMIRVLNEDLGVYDERGTTPTLTFIDPENFDIQWSIDIADPQIPSHHRAQDMARRDNILFTVARPEAGGNFDQVYIQATDFDSGEYLGVTTFDVGNRFVSPLGINTSSTFPNFGGFGFQSVDEQGNVYVFAESDPLNQNPISAVLKIPAGSTEFDPDYFFVPALVADQTNQFFPTANGFFYMGNGLAVASVAIGTPQELVDYVVSLGGPQFLDTEEEIAQVTNILFEAKNAQWSVLDLVNQTVTPITGIPSQSPVSFNIAVEVDGVFYLTVQTEEENAYYRLDGTTATKAFDIVGGTIGRFYDLSKNN